MRIALLLTPDLGKVPDGIEIEENFGLTTIITTSHLDWITGDHVILSGDQEAFIKWLSPFPAIWLGRGSPQLEHFEVAHIKEEYCGSQCQSGGATRHC